MIGGLVGNLATQGGFMGNSGGMAEKYGVAGLAGQAINQFGALTGGVNGLMSAIGPDQQPAQGPNTPVRNYGGKYMPYGPGGGGVPPTPTPMASMYGGPQMGQAGGLLGNANFFSDPMTIKRMVA